MPTVLNPGDVIRFERPRIFGTDCEAGETAVVRSCNSMCFYVEIPDPHRPGNRSECNASQDGCWHFNVSHFTDGLISRVSDGLPHQRKVLGRRNVKPLKLP